MRNAPPRRNLRQAARLWQFQDQWIGREKGSLNFSRYWYESSTGRVRRKSLGTADLEEAKVRLIRTVLGDAPEDPLAPDQVYFAAVTKFYLDNHAVTIRSEDAAKRACALVLAYLKKASETTSPRVSDFTLARQHAFMRWCRDEHRLTAKSISTYLSTIKAAMHYAATPRIMIDSKGNEREGRILSAPFFIEATEKAVCKVTGLVASTPRSFIPNDGQVAAFIDATFDANDPKEVREREHLFRYCIIALNTWARPEAICDLDVERQVDFQRGLLDLNPPGRPQNKKVRPLIRLTDNLRGWLLYWNDAKPIRYGLRPVSSISPRSFAAIAARAGTPGLVRYTLRHYMNTRAMSVPEAIRPTREERAQWMGHLDPRFRTTQGYEHFSPDYLVNCARATDAILLELDKKCRKSLVSPNSLPSRGLTLIEKTG